MIFRPILEGAGFSGLDWTEQRIMMQVGATGAESPAERATATLLRIGPLARRLKGLPPETRAMVAARLLPELEPFVRDGWVTLPGVIWVIRARA
jgi:hypothetical protein